ncbi:MAG: PEP-CTERM sorting domain-containing protein [Phycisphaerae bacterium]|nr:PEP-CTERM sorting domain-containing protein [Phycisphaerae bacterium]
MKNRRMTLWLAVVPLIISTGADAFIEVSITGGSHFQITSGDWWVNVHDTSSVDIYGGQMYVYLHQNSKADIFGGTVYYHETKGESRSNISGGTIWTLWAIDRSRSNISGGNTGTVYAKNQSRITISGGMVNKVSAADSSFVRFTGYDFEASDGLSFVGEPTVGWQIALHGCGTLSGKWADGTSWTTSIENGRNMQVYTIVPEPTTLLILGFGGLGLLKPRNRYF